MYRNCVFAKHLLKSKTNRKIKNARHKYFDVTKDNRIAKAKSKIKIKQLNYTLGVKCGLSNLLVNKMHFFFFEFKITLFLYQH